MNDITDEDILKFDLLTDADEGIVLHVLPEEEEMVEENLEELEEEMVEENLEIQEEEIGTEEAANEKDTDIAMFVESRRGKTVLQFNGYRYRKLYKNRQGTRWACSAKKTCSAYVYTNDNNEIIITNQSHNHDPPKRCDFIDNDQDDTAVVITSRKGKEMLLFRQYTYRKQYDKGMKTRWVCSTLKNCKACIFTDESNYITSSFDEHIHDPPQYYTKPKNILQALREPLILDTD